MDADLTSDEITSLRADAAVAPRVHVTSSLVSHQIDMNLAVAPFDDIHVRRAISRDEQALDCGVRSPIRLPNRMPFRTPSRTAS